MRIIEKMNEKFEKPKKEIIFGQKIIFTFFRFKKLFSRKIFGRKLERSFFLFSSKNQTNFQIWRVFAKLFLAGIAIKKENEEKNNRLSLLFSAERNSQNLVSRLNRSNLGWNSSFFTPKKDARMGLWKWMEVFSAKNKKKAMGQIGISARARTFLFFWLGEKVQLPWKRKLSRKVGRIKKMKAGEIIGVRLWGQSRREGGL